MSLVIISSFHVFFDGKDVRFCHCSIQPQYPDQVYGTQPTKAIEVGIPENCLKNIKLDTKQFYTVVA